MKYLPHFIRSALPLSSYCSGRVVTGIASPHGGLLRNYRLYLRPPTPPGEALPLVFNFHGFGSNAAQQEFYSGMNMVADTGIFRLLPQRRGQRLERRLGVR